MINRDRFPGWVGYLPLFFLFALIVTAFWMRASANPLGQNEGGSQAYDAPSTLVDGDAIYTANVTCSSVTVSTSPVTLLTSTQDASGGAWTISSQTRTRPRLRKRTFQNTDNGTLVYIGSNSLSGLIPGSGNQGGYALNFSSYTGSVYETHNSTDFYCNGKTKAGIVTVIEEYNSAP